MVYLDSFSHYFLHIKNHWRLGNTYSMEKTSTKQHWQSYWKTPDHQPPVVHEEMLSELQHITNIKGKKILEIGCGDGGVVQFLKDESETP